MRISRRMTVVTEENAVFQYFYLLDARNAPSPSLKRFAQLSNLLLQHAINYYYDPRRASFRSCLMPHHPPNVHRAQVGERDSLLDQTSRLTLRRERERR